MDAGDVVLEADPQPNERLAEQLALLLLLERAVELLVRQKALAQRAARRGASEARSRKLVVKAVPAARRLRISRGA